VTGLVGAEDTLVDQFDPTHPVGYFDRFYFNMHGEDRRTLLLFGGGLYPPAGVADGWAIAIQDGEQTNLRFSDRLDELPTNSIGPLSWGVLAPSTWHLALAPNASGIEIDAVFTGRLDPYHYSPLVFGDGAGGQTDFDHAVQSGTWEGHFVLHGVKEDVSGYWGQRDRSRGVRLVHAKQGMHLWVQPQFHDGQISVMYDEDRHGAVTLCEGAVIASDGTKDAITAVRHRLDVDDALEVSTAHLEIETAAGRHISMDVDMPRHEVAYFAGGGYDGRHGKFVGRDHIATERWPLDGTLGPRSLGTPLSERLASFATGDHEGVGIFETAFSRSSSYTYRPTC